MQAQGKREKIEKTADTCRRVVCAEVASVQVCLENPLQVMLVLSDITLLWTFLPSINGKDNAQLISNEVTSSVKVGNGAAQLICLEFPTSTAPPL